MAKKEREGYKRPMPRGELLADKGIPLGQAAEAAAVAILVIGTVSYTLHLVSIESKRAHTPAPNTPTLRKLTLGDFCLRRRRLFFSLLFPDARCLCLRARACANSGEPLPPL